jgi:tricorn protease
MNRVLNRTVLLLCLLVIARSAPAQPEGNVDLPRYPSINHDGTQILFSWRGDLWKVGAGGGSAQRLTSHPQDELASVWSRDGKRIAFISNRTGSANIFMMDADGTAVRQVTDFDRPISLFGFGVDEEGNDVLSVAARQEPDWYPGARIYTVTVKGGDLLPIHDAYGLAPAISPDGSRVLFNRGGASWSRRHYRGPDTRDVWLYDRNEKTFTRLTTWSGNDGRAKWINDDTFVYASDRQDNTVNLYRLKLGQDERQAVRLTPFTDTDVEEFDVSADGKTLVFAKWNRLYTLDLAGNGAEPKELVIRASEDEGDRYQLKDIGRTISEAALSPDGKTMAYIAYGEVYVRAVEKNSPTRRVTATAARERDVAWAPDGTRLYFSGDQSGIEAIYSATVQLTRGEIRREYDRATRTADEPTTQPAEVEIDPPADEPAEAESAGAEPATEEPTTLPATEPGSKSATQPATQPGDDPARWTDAVAFNIELISTSEQGDRQPSPSPDGKWLALRRGVGNLVLINLSDKETRPILEHWSPALDWRWSPDSRHIAYVTEDQNFNSDIWIVPTDGKAEAVNVTRHPDNDVSPRWSADGRVLAFLSERVNNEYDVWMVWLDKEMEALTPPEVDQYYKDAVAAAKKREPLSTKKSTTRPAATQPARSDGSPPREPPATRAEDTDAARKPPERKAARPVKEKLDLDDAWLRLRRVTTLAGSESQLELTPGGDKYLFVATVGTQRGLYSLDRDATEPKRLGGAVNAQHLSLAGDQLVFVEQGRGGIVKLPGGEVEYLDIADKIRLDLAAQSSQKFLEAARILALQYYDPKMNGLDWPELTQRYHELARAARTSDEFDHVAAKLLGELNGSHLGINSPDAPNPLSRPYGKLGITSRRIEQGYEVTSVLPEGPADRSLTRLQPGDVITTIDLQPIAPDETLDAKLAGLTDREIIVGFTRTLSDGSARDLTALLTPVSYTALSELFYKNWRLDMVKKVDEWSNGMVGYIHIQSMGQPSLEVFERDLYAAAHGKKGLIIDVRNNGGGWTTDRLLASIMYPRHAYTIARGQSEDEQDGYPQDRLFIQRYDGPVNMLCNEKSFSNAEIISHAFKTLKRGTLVGQQTAGGVISTGGTRLIDGTTVRIPYRGWFLPDGTNMENNGAMPDIVVPQTPEDESNNHDAQLRAAVEDLMKRVK